MPPSSKFAGVDFAEVAVEQVTPKLSELGQGFRCSRGEFVTYWRQGRVQREINNAQRPSKVLGQHSSIVEAGDCDRYADSLSNG